MKRLELIRKIVDNAKKKFICVDEEVIYKNGRKVKVIVEPTPRIIKYSKREVNRMIHNFHVYGMAIEKIELIVNKEKEIWAKCPYCGLEFTKIVNEKIKNKSFWCESCQKK